METLKLDDSTATQLTPAFQTRTSTVGEFELFDRDRTESKGLAPADQVLLIGVDKGICGGAPIIVGSRIAVHHIIDVTRRLGWDDTRLQKAYPHLSLRQIAAAKAYYASHVPEIDAFIEAEEQAE